MHCRVVTLKLADISEARTAAIALMMEAVRISETSINFNMTTRRYIPEDSKVHILNLFPLFVYLVLDNKIVDFCFCHFYVVRESNPNTK
jgi:hypothetical protein